MTATDTPGHPGLDSDTGAPAPLPIVPVGLRVEGKPMLVVGAGSIAARKATAYVDQGALVTAVAPDHSPDMDAVGLSRRIHRRFKNDDLEGMWFVVAATGNPDVDGAVFREAERRRIWCNAADDPAHCSVILPAVTRKGSLTIGIATGGTSPAAASWLRRRIEDLLDDDALAVVDTATRVRRAARDAGHPTEVPGWAEVLDNEALDLIRSGQPEELERRLFEAVVGS